MDGGDKGAENKTRSKVFGGGLTNDALLAAMIDSVERLAVSVADQRVTPVRTHTQQRLISGCSVCFLESMHSALTYFQ